MTDFRSTQRWMRCPTCQSNGYVHSVSTATPPTTCPQCHGECRVGNYWLGHALPAPRGPVHHNRGEATND